jgi:hypothetical protein
MKKTKTLYPASRQILPGTGVKTARIIFTAMDHLYQMSIDQGAPDRLS